QVAVEIISDTDGGPRALARRLDRYRRCGVEEVVHFDPADRERPLRLWDWVESDLVERDLAASKALYCDTLEAYWCLWTDPRLGAMLRVADGPDGSGLWPTPEEGAFAERDAAERRIAELEAELRRRGPAT